MDSPSLNDLLESAELGLRPASLDDCGQLTALMLASRAYQGLYRAMIEHYPVTPKMVEKGEVWVAEAKGRILGFYRLDFENSDLDLMFVEDNAQGLGVGRTMFIHMADLAASRGLSEIRIVAHPPAANFYRGMGAVDCGVTEPTARTPWRRPILRFAVPS